MIQSELLVGDRTLLGDLEITLFARRYLFKIPFMGLTWLKPESIQVRGLDGGIWTSRVRDRTRGHQIGLTVLIVMIGWFILRERNGAD